MEVINKKFFLVIVYVCVIGLYHPPPQTSKQLTPDDQWEKKAISGTRDQRVNNNC